MYSNSPHSVSSTVICIPSFDVMLKQLNEASRMVAHFTQLPLKNLQNSAKEEILLVFSTNYENYVH